MCGLPPLIRGSAWVKEITSHIQDGILMLDLGEFAQRMAVSPNTVRNLIKEGKIIEGEHYIHIGRVYRFPWGPEFIEKLMRALTPEPAPKRPKMHSQRNNRRQLIYRA